MSNETWLGVPEVAAILDVPKQTIYGSGKLRRSLPFIRCGRSLRMRPESLAAWAAEREAEQEKQKPRRCRPTNGKR